MINVPLSTIKEKILESGSMSKEELDSKIQVKLDQLSGLISEEGAAHIIANEAGVKLFETSGKLDIKNILPGMRNVEVVGKVVKKYEIRSFHTGERSGKVGSFLLGDSTGMVRVTLWNDQAEQLNTFNEGDVLGISSAYVRENNGRKELHGNQNSKMAINPPGVTIEVGDFKAQRKKLVDLAPDDNSVEVLATIVQVFDPRFFEVCPGCGKRAKAADGGYDCPKHGIVKEPDYSYVMNVFLDDGSDNVRTVLWREQAQQLLGVKDADMGKFRESPAEFESFKNDLLGNIVKVTGRVNKNDAFDRLELVVNKIEKNPNPEEEIQKLKEEADKVAKEPEPKFESASEIKEEKVEPVKEEKVAETEEEATFTEATKEVTETKTEVTLKKETKEPVVEDITEEELGDLDLDDDDITSIDDL